MAKKRPIKLKKGKLLELAKICNVSTNTVWEAMTYKRDTDLQAFLRKKAEELGFIRQF